MKENQVVIYTGCGKEQKRVVLYNFESIDSYVDNNTDRIYIRVCCDGKFHYFEKHISVIHSVTIYKRK